MARAQDAAEQLRAARRLAGRRRDAAPVLFVQRVPSAERARDADDAPAQLLLPRDCHSLPALCAAVQRQLATPQPVRVCALPAASPHLALTRYSRLPQVCALWEWDGRRRKARLGELAPGEKLWAQCAGDAPPPRT